MESKEIPGRTVCRDWYGKRSGLPQSFKDISNFYAAANFAASIVADRIEVVREPTMGGLVEVFGSLNAGDTVDVRGSEDLSNGTRVIRSR